MATIALLTCFDQKTDIQDLNSDISLNRWQQMALLKCTNNKGNWHEYRPMYFFHD